MPPANRHGARVTVRDIARELGVAVSTVGRVLSDSTRISEGMRVSYLCFEFKLRGLASPYHMP